MTSEEKSINNVYGDQRQWRIDSQMTSDYNHILHKNIAQLNQHWTGIQLENDATNATCYRIKRRMQQNAPGYNVRLQHKMQECMRSPVYWGHRVNIPATMCMFRLPLRADGAARRWKPGMASKSSLQMSNQQ